MSCNLDDLILDCMQKTLDCRLAYLKLVGAGPDAALDLAQIEGLLGSVFLYDYDWLFFYALIACEAVAAA